MKHSVLPDLRLCHAHINQCAIRTLDEVAREFGLTRERIRQIEVIALEKLRRRLYALGVRTTADPEPPQFSDPNRTPFGLVSTSGFVNVLRCSPTMRRLHLPAVVQPRTESGIALRQRIRAKKTRNEAHRRHRAGQRAARIAASVIRRRENTNG